jgi:uncharacterized protein YciI
LNNTQTPQLNDYVVAIYTPGPKWQPGQTAMEQGAREHIDYQHGLYDRGRLAMGGPWLDREGGMALFTVDSVDEARALTDADPLVQRGVYTVALYPWRESLGALIGRGDEHD